MGPGHLHTAVHLHTARARLHAQVRTSPRPITSTLRCPVDIGALRDYAAQPSGPSDPPADLLARDAERLTDCATITSFLASVTSIDGNTGYVDIRYRHSELTAALVDAGWVTTGREYAIGADPFKLPRHLRYLALRRFGRAFDDSASWPRAAAHIVPLHQGLARMLIYNREEILHALGALLLPQRDEKGRRKGIKQLFASVDLDGSYDAWAAGQGGTPTRYPCRTAAALCSRLPSKVIKNTARHLLTLTSCLAALHDRTNLTSKEKH